MTGFDSKTVLVVDDEEMIREILADLFKGEGANVLEASCGSEAMTVLMANDVDILVTDARTPNEDGLTLIRKLHGLSEKRAKPKIFLCSGYHDISAEEAKEIGILEVFSKPFNLDMIREEIKKHL